MMDNQSITFILQRYACVVDAESRVAYDGLTAKLHRQGLTIPDSMFIALVSRGYIYTNASLRYEYQKLHGIDNGTFYAFDIPALVRDGYSTLESLNQLIMKEGTT